MMVCLICKNPPPKRGARQLITSASGFGDYHDTTAGALMFAQHSRRNASKDSCVLLP
jgi:hypothetical protein